MTNLELAIFNASLYICLLLYSYRKSKRITLGVCLTIVYAAVACFCVSSVNTEPNRWQLTLWPFIYLFVCIYLLQKPILANPTIKIKLDKSNYNFYKKVGKFYIIIALFSCVVYMPVAYEHIVNPQWLDLYTDSHEVKDTNLFIKLSNLFFHIRYLGLILFFYFLSFGASKKYLVLIGVASVLPIVLVTICNASRGGLVALAVSLALTYFIFNNYLSPTIKRHLRTALMVIAPLGALYLIAVTAARFDPSVSYVSAEDSITYYLGHSMLMFNYGVVDTINHYWKGSYMFGLGELKYNGTHYGTDFFTIVGAFYQDYGPIISFLLILFISKSFNKIFRKSQIGIPELFLIITYAMLIFNGVFVVGVGFGVQFIEAIIIYKVLKKIQNKAHVRNNCILSSPVPSNKE